MMCELYLKLEQGKEERQTTTQRNKQTHVRLHSPPGSSYPKGHLHPCPPTVHSPRKASLQLTLVWVVLLLLTNNGVSAIICHTQIP